MDRGKITLSGVQALYVDLSSKESIDGALIECGGKIDALFSCAGVADGTPGIERINFIGHRHLIDRMFASDMFNKGAAIGMISSAATSLAAATTARRVALNPGFTLRLST